MLLIPDKALQQINEITTSINSVQELPTLLTVIMDTARELLVSESSSLLLYDEANDELIFNIVRGPRGELLARKRMSIQEGIAGGCARNREPIMVNDAESDERVFKDIDREIEFVTRNLLAVPLLARDRLIGVLEVLNTRDKRNFSRQDLQLLEYLANMAALAIQNRRLYDDLKDRADELGCIFEISQHLNRHDKLESLLDAVLESIEMTIGATRSSIILRGEESDEIEIVRLRGFSIPLEELGIGKQGSVSGMVLNSGNPILVLDIEKEPGIEVADSGRYNTGSFISAPIRLKNRTIGLLNAADKQSGLSFNSFDLKVLQVVAGQLGDAYGRILSRRKENDLINLRRDMQTAALIQINSLPQIPARIAGLEVATRYEASRDVGGDFYDLIYHSEDRISLVMADVAGKGVPAALFMEYSKTLLAGQISRNLDPVTTLTRTNNDIYARAAMSIFVTVALIQLERELHRMRLSCAGHNLQVLYRRSRKEVERIATKGPPLGVFENFEYFEGIVGYDPGDFLVLYTDGITEANNKNYDEFGEERLFEIILKNDGASPGDLIDDVFAEMRRFRGPMEPSDDATMMVIRL